MMSEVVPGWYDDGSGALRYWDGRSWTEHVADRPAHPTPASATRRKAGAWVWAVVGGVSVALLGLTVAVVLVLGAHAGAIKQARAAVAAYDEAWLDADCDALLASTTATFRTDWGYVECAAFVADATAFDQADRNYRTRINDARFTDGEVIVTTTESFTDSRGRRQSQDITYTVVTEGDHWRIDRIDVGGDTAHDTAT